MSWIDRVLWQALDPNSYEQRLPIDGMSGDARLQNIAKDINASGALSNNIEDRRDGYNENDYVRDKMRNSLLRTESPVDRSQPMILGPIDNTQDAMMQAMMNKLRGKLSNGK